ncbi:MAG: DUF3048 domain-containing protein [Chloroflexota bacterium]|nr:DUF3048 domain-containing protein [Chloroflexota bacterium]
MSRRFTPLAVALLVLLLAAVVGACSLGRSSDQTTRNVSSPTAINAGGDVGTAPTQPLPTPTATETAAVAQEQPPAQPVLLVRTGKVKASLFVDRVARGTTPAKVELAPGKHRVVVRARTYQTVARVVDLTSGQQATLELKLEPQSSPLRVLAGTRKAQVKVDGKLLGRTPLRTQVSPGRHVVLVYQRGYLPWKQRVVFAPAASRTLRLKLQPRPARLDIKTRPSRASVYIDGKWAGRTNRVIYRIKPGRHTVSVSKPEYKRVVEKHMFGPGGKLTLRRMLSRSNREVVLGRTAKLRHRPLAVMIENHPDARPQSGLDAADVVLEAPAEFGISRFIAFFINRDVPVIGPVRSARKYFVLWAKEFNPIYFHAGQSPGTAALADRIRLVRTSALHDGRAFYRTSDRVAPHNLYTSTAALMRVERAKGRGLRGGTWGGLRFKTPGTYLGPRKVSYINLHFNDYYYAEWRWDPARKVYRRWMQGVPHIERNTGSQVVATAVIVRIHNMYRIPGDPKAREEINVYGSGKAYIFQDGRLTRATWRKRDVNSPTLYYDRQGRRLAVNQGGVWIQVIPQYGRVRFR